MIFRLQTHFADRQAARAAVDLIARAWEIMIAFDVGVPDFELNYEKTEVVDRAPTPGTMVVQLEGIAATIVFGRPTVVRSLHRYQGAPDPTFQFTLDVELLWQRFRMYKEGREPILSMAYFALTVIEGLAGGRPPSAIAFNIEEDVLRKIGELSSTRGDSLTARKCPHSEHPLQVNEQAWLEEALKKVILQVGRSGAAPASTRLTPYACRPYFQIRRPSIELRQNACPATTEAALREGTALLDCPRHP